MTTQTCFTAVILTLLAAQPVPAQAARTPLPPVAVVHGRLQLKVAHPVAGSAIAAGDSTFLFGSTGDGRATLTINGQRVPVAPNGAWLAWIRIPPDSAFAIELEARLGGDLATLALPLRRSGWFRRTGAWVDRGSMSPVGDAVFPAGEAVTLSVRAVAGARVRLLLPDGRTIPFTGESPAASSTGHSYVATTSASIGTDGALLTARALVASDAAPMLEVVQGRDTSRVRWPLRLTRRSESPLPVRLDDDPQDVGNTDRVTIGRALRDGTYLWFFPRGTRTRAVARIDRDVLVQLDGGSNAWVPLEDVHLVPLAEDPRPAVMGSLGLAAQSGVVRLRIPLTRVSPVRVDESLRSLRITLYNVVGDADWTRYGAETGFVSSVAWQQELSDRLVIELQFDQPLWGWRVRTLGEDLVFEFREPPRIDPAHPLRGRHIVVDAGHPPAGACGPTGLCEPEANLAIALDLERQLHLLGAHVTMTRRGNESVGLWPRVALADSTDAELLVSIHNNALADGVNPATNVGTSTFYNHAAALPLARAVQDGLLRALGQTDLGVGRGDLALVRPTWYPAILTEGLFLMIPEQEAALRTPAGSHRYATGVVAGLTSYLRSIARLSTSTTIRRP